MWKDIYFYDFRIGEWIDYRGLYQVSDLGRVKSLRKYKYDGDINFQKTSERLLKPRYNSNGYSYVDLYLNGNYKRFYIHRLVGQMFVKNEKNKKYIDHIDTNKNNNQACNLRWVTIKENQNNILTKNKMSNRKNNIKTKIIALNKNINKVIVFESLSSTSRYGFDRSAVWRCCNKKQKKHLGYEFYYLKDYKKEKV